jgi:hypothetical protein
VPAPTRQQTSLIFQGVGSTGGARRRVGGEREVHFFYAGARPGVNEYLVKSISYTSPGGAYCFHTPHVIDRAARARRRGAACRRRRPAITALRVAVNVSLRRAWPIAGRRRGGCHGRQATPLMQVKHARAVSCDVVVAAPGEKLGAACCFAETGFLRHRAHVDRKPPRRLISGIEMLSSAGYGHGPRRQGSCWPHVRCT